MIATATYSRGWGARVELGAGQERTRRQLAASIRHPSRSWHPAPVMRDYGRSPSTAHRHLHRLAALGVIAIQTTLGMAGGTRFTFGVRFWRRSPVRRGMIARMTRQPEPETVPLFPDAGGLVPPEPPASQPPPIVAPPERAPVPQRDPALAGESFAEKMRRHGLDEATFWKTGWK